MKNIFIGIAIVALAVGSVVLSILGKPGAGVTLLSMLVLCFIFAVAIGFDSADTAYDRAANERMLDALHSASLAIHAFEDPDGKMPDETGEFKALQRAAAEVDRAIDLAMEVL